VRIFACGGSPLSVSSSAQQEKSVAASVPQAQRQARQCAYSVVLCSFFLFFMKRAASRKRQPSHELIRVIGRRAQRCRERADSLPQRGAVPRRAAFHARRLLSA